MLGEFMDTYPKNASMSNPRDGVLPLPGTRKRPSQQPKGSEKKRRTDPNSHEIVATMARIALDSPEHSPASTMDVYAFEPPQSGQPQSTGQAREHTAIHGTVASKAAIQAGVLEDVVQVQSGQPQSIETPSPTQLPDNTTNQVSGYVFCAACNTAGLLT